MSRPLALCGTAVALLLLMAGVAALWFVTRIPAPAAAVSAAEGTTAAASPGSAVAPLRSGDGGVAEVSSTPATGAQEGGRPAAPWVAGPMEMRAPTPDQIPCGDLACLSEDPERYRTEVHGMLAREGLELLLKDAGIEGEEAAELRAQLEANLDAFARGPEAGQGR